MRSLPLWLAAGRSMPARLYETTRSSPHGLPQSEVLSNAQEIKPRRRANWQGCAADRPSAAPFGEPGRITRKA
jgi:hypothetical protein